MVRRPIDGIMDVQVYIPDGIKRFVTGVLNNIMHIISVTMASFIIKKVLSLSPWPHINTF